MASEFDRPSDVGRDNSTFQKQLGQTATDVAKKSIERGKAAIFMSNERDNEIWELMCDVPNLTGIWPYILAIVNLFVPGLGTMIAACIGYP